MKPGSPPINNAPVQGLTPDGGVYFMQESF